MLAVAVIIPTLNEADQIGDLLAALDAHDFKERIVVDGGSVDGTQSIAARHRGVSVIGSSRGRGAQLNAGARAASAEILLFLHADTRLEPRACETICLALADTRNAGGCFRLRFDRHHPALALYSYFSRFDSFFTTFGDQAYFTRAVAFRDCGGFPEWPFLEDVELRRRLRRRGRFVKLNSTVVTSARRFAAEGVFKRQALNMAVLMLHLAGVPATRLARFYAARSGKAAKR